MELNYVTLIIKNINNVYRNVKQSRDIPFDLDDLKFNKTYNKIQNIAEVSEYINTIKNVKKRLDEDYSIYSNETHINYEQLYNDFLSSWKILNIFIKKYKNVLIEYSPDDLKKISEIITETVTDEIEYINFKYRELFLELKDIKFISFLTIDYKNLFKKNDAFFYIINYMCEFNIQQFKFKKELVKLKENKKYIEFINDLTSIFYTFKIILKVYFKLMVINKYSDDNVVNYSISYIN